MALSNGNRMSPLVHERGVRAKLWWGVRGFPMGHSLVPCGLAPLLFGDLCTSYLSSRIACISMRQFGLLVSFPLLLGERQGAGKQGTG